jgi:hypothetical protein
MYRALYLTVLLAWLSLPAKGNTVFRVDEAFPTLYLPALADGTPLSVADFRGQKVMLHIWASW